MLFVFQGNTLQRSATRVFMAFLSAFCHSCLGKKLVQVHTVLHDGYVVRFPYSIFIPSFHFSNIDCLLY